jgi:nitrogen fixation/metabolism regulation signal transduction histidine kinase
VPSMKLDDARGAAAPNAPNVASGSAAAPGSGSAAGSGADEEPRHVKVQIDESSMTLTQVVPPDLAEKIAAHWTCEIRQVATFDRLERGRRRILWAMIGTGLVLVLGLALYGIKMTHRVAGPLFKVSLYLSKMREGRFDKVYNLRKGDQLVDFYDHFKHAHGGVVAMQREDIARITAVIAAADAAGAGQHPAVTELRALLARKEKSIE